MKNRVKELREKENLTQKKLGEKVHVSRQAINAIETGKYDPSLWLAYDIAQLFHMTIEEVFIFKESEFVFKYDHFLSDSRWSLFIQNKNMKYVGLGMIGVAIIIDTFSALRRKKFDEYQIITLEKIMLFNGSFLNIIFPLSLFILIFVPAYFVETIFFFILFQWLCMIITEITYLIKNYK